MNDSLVLTKPSLMSVLHFIRECFPYQVAEDCRIGNGKIYYGRDDCEDNVIATYTFAKGSHLPVFQLQNGFSGPGFTLDRYRHAFQRLIKSYLLFGKEADGYLGNVSYQEPFKKNHKTYQVYSVGDEYGIKLINTDNKDDVIETSVFALKPYDSYEVETEVLARVRAYKTLQFGGHPDFDVWEKAALDYIERESYVICGTSKGEKELREGLLSMVRRGYASNEYHKDRFEITKAGKECHRNWKG